MDNRYYFDKVADNIILDKAETQHLSKVRRAKVGDIITGFCGDGYDYRLKVLELDKTAKCSIIDKQLNKATNCTPITVFLATLKNDALNESVDNLTQLNVKSIHIFDSKYSVASIDADKIDKLTLKSIQACKQCERADKVVLTMTTFKKMLASLSNYDLVLFAYENTTKPFPTDLKQYKNKNVAVIVGCEGGFSSDEAQQLSEVAQTVSLGKTILRAPVGCTAIVSAVMSAIGEWQYEV